MKLFLILRFVRRLPLFLASIGVPIATARAETASLVVTTTADSVTDDEQISLREAVSYAQTLGGTQRVTFSGATAGGAVDFYDGTARTITLNGNEIAIDANTSITGPGADKLTISGSQLSRIFNIGSLNPAIEVTLTGLTLANGRAKGANGFYNGYFNPGQPGLGGALYNVSTGTLSINDCVISGSLAQGGGGSSEGQVSQPGAGGYGGAIYNSSSSGTLSLLRTTLAANSCVAGYTFRLARWSPAYGAGIYNAGGAQVQLTDCVVSENTVAGAAGGGGIYTSSTGAVTITNCAFSNNSAQGRPSGSTIQLGHPTFGGALFSSGSGTVNIEASTFTRNHVTGYRNQNPTGEDVAGGALYLMGTSPSVGQLVVSHSTFVGNTARAAEEGPGSWAGGRALGGAVANHGVQSLVMVNCTLSGNLAIGGYLSFSPAGRGDGYGGAIANLGSGSVAITHVTLFGNLTQYGGPDLSSYLDSLPPSQVALELAIYGRSINASLANLGAGTFTLANTLAANLGTSNVAASGIFISAGHNLIGNVGSATGFTGLGDQVGTPSSPINPWLGPLADNGGPTLTMALLPGSPALDAGTLIAGLTTDQRGFARPVGPSPDIGALEDHSGIGNPTVSYTPLADSLSLVNRTLSGFATITDNAAVSGGPQSPRFYFKKLTDADAFNVPNNSSGNGWKFVIASNASSPYDFLVDYSLLLGAGVAPGDTIQYFVVAQDGANNLSSSPAGATGSAHPPVQHVASHGGVDSFRISGSGLSTQDTWPLNAENQRESAPDLSSWINQCSPNARFSTAGATADGPASTGAPNGPGNNVWFKFKAPANGTIELQVSSGGVLGTLQYGWATLWSNSGTQLAFSGFNYQQYGVCKFHQQGLTPGETYYVSVDNYDHSPYPGTFTLCLWDGSQHLGTMDERASALDITGLINNCSPSASLSNVGATPSGVASSGAPNGPNSDVWFKVIAPASGTLDFSVTSGGEFGTLQYGWATLWDESNSQLAFSGFAYKQYGTFSFQRRGLIPGTIYYVSVDNFELPEMQGTFTICLTGGSNTSLSSDVFEESTDVTAQINNCSGPGAYNNLNATQDGPATPDAPNGPNYNVWFKFTAPATGTIDAQIRSGGEYGTLQYGWATLWTSDRSPLAFTGFQYRQYGSFGLQYQRLTPGEVYYISVDNFEYSYMRGTFTLCLSDGLDRTTTFDNRTGAVDVTGLLNNCSGSGRFATTDATGDGLASSGAPNGPNYNVWFKFTASSTGTISVNVSSGGELGTLQYGWATLWDDAGTEMAFSGFGYQQYGTFGFEQSGLTPGNTYYISVDNFNYIFQQGTFTLCIGD